MHGHIDVLNNVLCKCVPVLTLDVLQIVEDIKYAGTLTTSV